MVPATRTDPAEARGVSVRWQLSRSVLLVLLIALVPAVVSIRYLQEAERGAAEPPVGERPETGGASRATRNAITFGLLALVAGSVVVLRAPATLRRSLAQLGAILEQAGTGNLNVASAYSRVKEVDHVAIALNRTLGRLRHVDELKSVRIRDEKRLSEALVASSIVALGIADAEARVVRANRAFLDLVGVEALAAEGARVRDVLGQDVERAVRHAQRERELARASFRAANEREMMVEIVAVNDEVDRPPRTILRIGAAEALSKDG